MITVEYVRQMAQYNAWQNKALTGAADTLETAELLRHRGAFFGSILGTLNHLLWGDRLWMHRFDGWEAPEGGIAESATLLPTYAAWRGDRMRADGHILLWARRLRPVDLRGEARWYSGSQGRYVTKPVATCVAHMFNHQTHHRGQVHAMLTAAGATTSDTDLVFMPEEI